MTPTSRRRGACAGHASEFSCMSLLTSNVASLTLGVLVALYVTIRTTKNPSSIPLKRVLLRALPGFFFFVVVWVLVGLVVWTLRPRSLSGDGLASANWALSFLVGFVLPLALGGLKDLVLTKRFAAQVKAATTVLQGFDEITRLYLTRLLDREERKITYEILSNEYGLRVRAVDRLFEFHALEIAHEISNQLQTDRGRASSVLGIRDVKTKLKYLLRHLGYADCVRHVNEVCRYPECIYPTWPVHENDRRRSDNALKTRERRRRVDQGYAHAYIDGTIPPLT